MRNNSAFIIDDYVLIGSFFKELNTKLRFNISLCRTKRDMQISQEFAALKALDELRDRLDNMVCRDCASDKLGDSIFEIFYGDKISDKEALFKKYDIEANKQC